MRKTFDCSGFYTDLQSIYRLNCYCSVNTYSQQVPLWWAKEHLFFKFGYYELASPSLCEIERIKAFLGFSVAASSFMTAYQIWLPRTHNLKLQFSDVYRPFSETGIQLFRISLKF